MGPRNDSWWYPDSIFYEGHQNTSQLVDIDEAVVTMLYDPRIKPEMTMEELGRLGL